MADHEHLATGWDEGTPVDDNLLRAVTLAMADVTTGAAMGHRTRTDAAFEAVDYGVPAGFGNIVTLLQPLPHDGWSVTMDEIEAFFAGGRGEVLLFSAWPTPDLRARGWKAHGHPPLMLRPAGPPPPSPGPEGLRIVEVDDDRALADFERTLVEAFPLDDAAHLLPGGLFGPAMRAGRWRLFVGYAGEDGEAVATAAAYVDHGHNDVNYVATQPAWRGRGFGEALTWRATLADPAWPAALLASDAGRPIYEGMGYRSVLRFALWGWPRD